MTYQEVHRVDTRELIRCGKEDLARAGPAGGSRVQRTPGHRI